MYSNNLNYVFVLLERVAIPFSRASFHPEIEPGSLIFQGDSLPSEHPGESKVYQLGLPFPSPGDLPNFLW